MASSAAVRPADTKDYAVISAATAMDASRGGLHFILVGAGGNGARVTPPLMQILHPGDHLSILDHDVVEDRNLGRQNFAPRDVGRFKALVLAQRYARNLGGDPLGISAHTVQLTEETAAATMANLTTERPVQGHVFIGCVDNAAARRAILAAMQAFRTSAWVDVGNSFKDGQVVLSLRGWPVISKFDGIANPAHSVNLRGMELAMPQLLVSRPEEAEEASCRDRVDLQSVMINVQAASAALNVVSWLKLRSPIMNAGAFFNSMCTSQPIRITGYSPRSAELVPDTSYAASAA
jgi:PRTRC genetic system ThiF family protein